MTPLAVAVRNLLQAEAGMPPLKADSISRVLWVTGASPEARPATVEEVESALLELMREGFVDRVYSPRMGPRYRAMPHRGAVAADETDRPLPTPSPGRDR